MDFDFSFAFGSHLGQMVARDEESDQIVLLSHATRSPLVLKHQYSPVKINSSKYLRRRQTPTGKSYRATSSVEITPMKNKKRKLFHVPTLSISPTPTITSLEELPGEVIVKIFEFLSLQQLCKCMMVCRWWHQLACDNSLWRYLFVRDGLDASNSFSTAQPTATPSSAEFCDWRLLYARLHSTRVRPTHTSMILPTSFSFMPPLPPLPCYSKKQKLVRIAGLSLKKKKKKPAAPLMPLNVNVLANDEVRRDRMRGAFRRKKGNAPLKLPNENALIKYFDRVDRENLLVEIQL